MATPSEPKPLVAPKPSALVGKMSRKERREAHADPARRQLLACAKAVAELAEHREIKATHVRSGVDLEIRAVLATVVRRWSMMVPVTYITDEAAAPLNFLGGNDTASPWCLFACLSTG